MSPSGAGTESKRWLRWKFPVLLGTLTAVLCLCACSEAPPRQPEAVEVSYSEIPLTEAELPAGPNREFLVMACLSCHSPSYITMQPPFPRKVWEATVTKMVETYGAQVRPYDRKLIVDYLMTIRGNPPRRAGI
jgi:hypothetical protein